MLVHIEAPLETASERFGSYRSVLSAIDEHTTERRTEAERAEYLPGWLSDLSVPYRVIGDDVVRAAFAEAAERTRAAFVRSRRRPTRESEIAIGIGHVSPCSIPILVPDFARHCLQIDS